MEQFQALRTNVAGGSHPGVQGRRSLGSAREMFLFLCFAIDPYQSWWAQGTEAGALVCFGLALNVWCPKDTVRKPECWMHSWEACLVCWCGNNSGLTGKPRCSVLPGQRCFWCWKPQCLETKDFSMKRGLLSDASEVLTGVNIQPCLRERNLSN